MSSQVSLTDQGGSLRAQEQVLTAYGTHYGTNPWYVETVVSFGRRAFELERQVSFIASGNPVNATASSDPQGSYVNAVLGSGYDYAFRNGFSVGLNATLAYSSSTIEAFEETSAGGLNLALEEQKIESMVFSLGTQMQKPVGTRYGVFLPQFSVHWNHEFQQEGTPIRARFVNDPFGTQFSFTTEERDQDYLLIAAGASLVVPGGLTAFFNLDTQLLIDNFEQSSVALGVRKEY
ncbi:MAG: autotransporter outer membrane beta-barrel domain-containing protein, partial [Gammaproteobacteria bacterium]|nr:autotransporter outer membrane beta-barrel domain-containing protein [Gammaproteobacteria bacterium]